MPISAIRTVGSEHEEAPEDERMHQPRDESLEQLALPEHDLGLVAGAARDVAGSLLALGGGGALHEADQQTDASDEQRAADGEGGGQRQRGDRRGYPAPLVLRISAEIAGTTSWRSPITA